MDILSLFLLNLCKMVGGFISNFRLDLKNFENEKKFADLIEIGF